MANGYLKAAYESIPGNELNSPTLSTKILYPPLITFLPKLNPAPLGRDDELRNTDQPLQALPDLYAPTWDYESRVYPDLAAFLLKLILGPPVTTAGNGVITEDRKSVV